MDTGTLFTITPDDVGGWTGDMSAVLTLTNAHELVAAYRILVLEIEIHDAGDPVATPPVPPASIGTTEYLTMGNGELSIEFSQTAYKPFTVEITDGWYISHRGGLYFGRSEPKHLLSGATAVNPSASVTL